MSIAAMMADAKRIKWACKTVWSEGADNSKGRLKPVAVKVTKEDRAVVAAATLEAAKIHDVDVRRVRSPERSQAPVEARHHAWFIAEANGVNSNRIAEIFDRDQTSIAYGIRQHKKRAGV